MALLSSKGKLTRDSFTGWFMAAPAMALIGLFLITPFLLGLGFSFTNQRLTSPNPTEFVGELTASGFLASLIPEEYGGSGLPLRAAAVVLEEINASGCTASQGHAQMYIMGTLLRHGSPEQKQRYLPKIASGELRLQAFGVTEPTTGSDTTKLKTRAVRAGNGDHYLVSVAP